MSSLPYHTTSVSGWIAAASGSALIHAAVFGVAFGVLQGTRQLTPAVPQAAPDFTVMLEQLDADTLTALVGQQDIGATDLTAPDDPSTDPQTPAGPATANRPEPQPEPPEASAPPLETPTITEPAAPGLAEPAPPEVTPPETPPDLGALPNPELQAPTHTDPVPSVPVAPDPVAQSPVILFGGAPAQTAGPVVAEASSGFDIKGGTEASPAQPAAGQIALAHPMPQLPEAPGAGTMPSLPAPAARPPTQQDLALADLIRTIRAAPLTPCLVSLPRRDGALGVGLAMIGDDGQEMTGFSQNVLADFAGTIRQTRTLIDPRQCPALNFVARSTAYPAAGLGVRLDSVQVPSGGRLTGIVRGVAGKAVLMIVVDANGVVQDLDKFTSLNGNYARFEVPVTRSGPQRDAAQLLIVIATPQPVQTLRSRMGQLARDVFAGLDGRDLADAALAVTTFDVR